ncbi:MAG: hypothetical protein ACOX4M_09015 [Acetivibrionales bacterium]
MEKKTDAGFAALNDRIGMLDKGNKEEFRKLNKKIDIITEAVLRQWKISFI